MARFIGKEMTNWTGAVLALFQGFGIPFVMLGLERPSSPALLIGGTVLILVFGFCSAAYQKQHDRRMEEMLQEIKELRKEIERRDR